MWFCMVIFLAPWLASWATPMSLSPQVFLNQENPPVATDTQPTAPIAPPTGPMRVELLTLMESRVRNIEPRPGTENQSAVRFQVKITGERLPEVVRAGRLVVEEAKDDTGKDVIDPEFLKEREKTVTTQVTMNSRILQQGYLPSETRLLNSPRAAQALSVVRGYVNLVYGKETEDVVVENPLRFEGGVIDHPRLKELGIELRVMKLGEEAKEPGDGRGIAIKFTDGEDNVRGVDFFDGWYRRMNTRPRVGKTDDDKRYTYFAVGSGKLDQDCSMVVVVYPKIERQSLPFKFENVELP